MGSVGICVCVCVYVSRVGLVFSGFKTFEIIWSIFKGTAKGLTDTVEGVRLSAMEQ